MKKYFWNFNEYEEVWGNACDTIDECISEAKREKVDRGISEDYVFIGEIEEYKPKVDIEYLIDNVMEQAYEECGECAKGWLDGLRKEDTRKLDERLNEVFTNWLKETNNTPHFGNFIEVVKYNLETEKNVTTENLKDLEAVSAINEIATTLNFMEDLLENERETEVK